MVAVVNSKAGDNLGFGVSAVLAGRVLTELLADGTYEYAYMGIRLRSVGPLLARANDVDRLETRPGDTISATVLRDGEERTELNCRLVEASPGQSRPGDRPCCRHAQSSRSAASRSTSGLALASGNTTTSSAVRS